MIIGVSTLQDDSNMFKKKNQGVIMGIYIQLYTGILNVAILSSPEFLNSQAFIKKFSLPPEREGM